MAENGRSYTIPAEKATASFLFNLLKNKPFSFAERLDLGTHFA